MRFILMGDRHNSMAKPANRIDDYFETTKAKDKEIKELALKYNAKAILHPGDFWTDGDAKIKNELVSDVINRWFNIDNPSTNIPLVGIAGNHDLIGGNVKSLSNTTAGLLDSIGFMPLVSRENPIIYKMDNGKTVAITGTNYQINVDKPTTLDDYIVEEKLGDYHIHIVHGMLTPKSYGQLFRHTTIDQIKHTKADITFCGHDHIGFDTIEHEGKFFVNPGAVVRLKNDVKEMKRVVKVVLVDISEKGITLTDIPLISALPGEMVLDREVIEKKKEKLLAAEEMKAQIKQLQISQKIRFDDILEEVYIDKNIDKEIIEDLSKRLNEKRVENGQDIVAPKDVWIEELELNNFQSHKNTKINLSKNLNVALGESRQGKTSILRSIRWVLENKPSGTSMIRNGETSASVKMRLNNGTIIIREIGPKINGYKIILPNGEIQEGNTKMVELVQALCGFNHMMIDSKLSLPINFMRQGIGWYLIGDELSSTDRARILGSLQNTNSADAVVKDLDKENTQITASIKNNNKQVFTIVEEIQSLNKEKEQLETIKNIVSLKVCADKIREYLVLRKKVEEYTNVVHLLESNFNEVKIVEAKNNIRLKLENITTIQNSVKAIKEETKRINVCNYYLQKLNNISKVEENIVLLKEKKNLLENINDNILVIQKESQRQRKINSMLSTLSKTKDTQDVEKVRKLLDKKEIIMENMKTLSKSSRIIKLSNKFIESANIVDNYQSQKDAIKSLLEKSTNIKEYQKEIVNEKTKIKKANDFIKQKEETINKLIEDKGALLKEAKVCPTCSGIISDDIVKHLHEKEI